MMSNMADELLDKPLQENEVVKSNIEIKYHLPKFYHRVLGNLIDILLVAFVFICSFLIARSIILNSDSYKTNSAIMKTEQLNSGLYVEKEGSLVDLVSYISDGGFTAKGKAETAQKGIVQLSDYIVKYMSSDVNKQKEDTYKKYFLDESMVFTDNGKTYPYIKDVSFATVDGKYTTSLVLNVMDNYPYLDSYEKCLKPFLSDYCFSIFQSYDTNYKESLLAINNMFVVTALPVCYVISGLLVYFVPPLFFRRGRKTLGKALYKIGLIKTKDCYVPSFKLWLARFGIFFVGVYCLSLVTFGIPMIISFTLMCTTKKKQGFADYMLNFTEVDTSKNKLFFDSHEIYLDMIRGEKEPVNFRMKDEL